MKNNIINGYIFLKNVRVFALLMLCFYIIAFFSDCAEVARKCSVQEIRYTIFFIKISVYRSFGILCEIIPYILLMSNSIILSKINFTEELTVLKTNGFSIFQILKPFIIFAIIVGFVNILIIHPYSILTAQKTLLLEHKLLGESIDKNESKSNIWVEKSAGNFELLIYVNNISNDTLNTINIYTMDKQHQFQNHIFAKSASIRNGEWILFNGAESKKSSNTKRFNTKIFKTDLTIEDMKLYYKSPMTLNLFEMYKISKLRKNKGLPHNTYVFSINFLIAKIIFTLIAALFPVICFFRHHRYTTRWFNILEVTIFAFFLNFFVNSIRSIGINSELSPFVTCWIPSLLLLFCEILAIRYKEQIS